MLNQKLTYLSSLLIFLYSTTILATGKSYSYIAAMLCLVSLATLPKLIKNKRPSDFYLLISAFMGYFLVTGLSLMLLGGKLSNLDMPSRVLFIIPVFIFLWHYPPKKEWLFNGILAGSFLSGVIALYHYQILEIRAFSSFKYMVIQSGNMAMSLGVFSLIISIQYLKDKKSYLMAIALICASFGFLASLLSGARGGWLIAPFVIVWLLVINRQLITKKVVLGLLIISVVGGVVSKDLVEQRVQKVIEDLTLFSEKGNSNTSVGARLEMWKSGIYTFKNNPIFGTGYQNRLQHKQALVDQKIVDPIVLQYKRLHNNYIEEASTKGMIGILALLLFFCVPLYLFSSTHKVKHNPNNDIFRQLGIAHIVLVMGYCLTQNYVNHHSGILHYLFYTVIFYALFIQTDKLKK